MTDKKPITVGSYSPDQFSAALTGPGLGLSIGPFDIHLRVSVPGLGSILWNLYCDYPVLDHERVFSCHVSLKPVRTLRPGSAGRKVRFEVDARPPHEDMPAAQALAVLEWGINLVLAMRHRGYLLLHSAAVERGGRTLLLPAWPGHGKTTLCAALAHRGWRLLSDEFGVVKPGTTDFLPVPRLMPLKNESIDVIRLFVPEAIIGPAIKGTRKGTVAHVRPPTDSILRARQPAPAGWLVFPRWVPGAGLMITPIRRAEAFMQLATNAFNYELLGEPAFDTVRRLVDTTDCYRLVYSDLQEAVRVLTEMADGAAP